MIQDHSDHGVSKTPTNPYSAVDSSVPLIHHDASDLGSFRIQNPDLDFPKKRTLSVLVSKLYLERHGRGRGKGDGGVDVRCCRCQGRVLKENRTI